MAKKISPFVFRNISSEDSNGMGPYEGVKEARAKESGPRRIGRLSAKLAWKKRKSINSLFLTICSPCLKFDRKREVD